MIADMKPQHHRYSASGAEGWMSCPGKLAMEKGKQESHSLYADEGSAAHFLAYTSLSNGLRPSSYIGKEIICWVTEDGQSGQNFVDGGLPKGATTQSIWAVTEDMADNVGEYVKLVLKAAKNATLLVEQKVEFGNAIGLPGAFGTADSIALSNDGKILTINDLKYGYAIVDAELNPQLLLYALGAIQEMDLVYDLNTLTTLRLIISQPRQNSFPVWSCNLIEPDSNGETVLGWFSRKAAEAVIKSEEALTMLDRVNSLPPSEIPTAQRGWFKTYLNPTEKGCKWCKVGDSCPARMEENLNTVIFPTADMDDLDDLDEPSVKITEALPNDVQAAMSRVPTIPFQTLANIYAALPQIKDFIAVVEKRMLTEMLAGEKHKEWKLVNGRPGNRAWKDAESAKDVMRTMRVKKDEMFEVSLISPTAAENLFRKKRPRVWKALEGEIARSDGKPVVASMSDKRQSINPHNDDLAFLPDLREENRVTIDTLIEDLI